MKALRILKRRMALTIAVMDIGNVWQIDKITQQLSQIASITLSAAISLLLRSSPYRDVLNIKDDLTPEKNSGIIVIGMGKLGAYELNYSSDLDLIVLYDTDKIASKAPEKLLGQLVRLTRQLLKIMNERTADGYVFRIDLRLRPDPGATPIALSVAAAETYYESLGQNWERAAMIKARPVAGDLKAGAAFLKNLTPFVWRKSLDFAAIQDIQSIKRQINVQNSKNSIKCEGHNIKLGNGGIREIEFFAQTLQLIWGGREPELRSPQTVQALQSLVASGHCDRETSEELIDSYRFLRRTEHRLQMINDEQTQTLPKETGGFAQLATFLGYKTPDAFRSELSNHLNRTHDHYRRLFYRATSLTAGGKGNLSFTGGGSDPETLKTISNMGFAQPDRADSTVRGWHHGRYRALRNNRTRELLTELLPSLMEAISHTPDPDMALLNFDEFLQGLPAGVQLFTMIKTNPQIMNLLAEIMGMAPRLAAHLTGRPVVLDSVLTPGFFERIPPATDLKKELKRSFEDAEYTEDILNITRRWAHDRRFQVGVQRLRKLTTSIEAAIDYSSIAETALECMFTPIADEFIAKHGDLAGGEIAFIAVGKLGSREMTANSDLDLIITYRALKDENESNGERPLSTNQYFARLSQRQINALTVLTPEGGLFEVDMRLRPLGESGPIASKFSSLSTYYRNQAWTWEHMALTRARVIFATSDIFRLDIESEIRKILTIPRDKNKLLIDVSAMRSKLAREKPTNCLWSLKHLRGGMLDIEFIAQYLALRHANTAPSILTNNTLSLIENLTLQKLHRSFLWTFFV